MRDQVLAGRQVSQRVRRLDEQARIIVGWPECRCNAFDYEHVRWEGPIQWIRPLGPMGKVCPRVRWCRHRHVLRALIRAYRSGEREARASK